MSNPAINHPTWGIPPISLSRKRTNRIVICSHFPHFCQISFIQIQFVAGWSNFSYEYTLFFWLWKRGTQNRRRIPANSSSFGGPCLKGTICCQRTKPNKTQHKSSHMSSKTHARTNTLEQIWLCVCGNWKINRNIATNQVRVRDRISGWEGFQHKPQSPCPRQIEKNLLLSFNKFNPDNASPPCFPVAIFWKILNLESLFWRHCQESSRQSHWELTKIDRAITRFWKRLDKEYCKPHSIIWIRFNFDTRANRELRAVQNAIRMTLGQLFSSKRSAQFLPKEDFPPGIAFTSYWIQTE